MAGGWSQLLEEARSSGGKLAYPLRAYSEFMPPPYVGVKPYGEPDPFTISEGDDHGWNISEYEWHFEIRPGIERIATHVLDQVVKLARGQQTQFSARTLVENPFWPTSLSMGAGSVEDKTFSLILPISLSRTQDDKGRVRWTLLGSGPPPNPFGILAACLRESFARERADAARLFQEAIAWAAGVPVESLLDPRRAGVRIFSGGGWTVKSPRVLLDLVYSESEPIEATRLLVAFHPFSALPSRIQWAYMEGRIRLIPSPESLVFWGHTGYRALQKRLPWAREVALLHLFPRSAVGDGIRIPQTGWLDELSDEQVALREGHRRANTLQRTHRWQRVARDEEDAPSGSFEDRVTAALFSVRPDDVHLYGKPMARNCQAWTEDYSLLLNGPEADPSQIRRAEKECRAGGRFGYTLFYPPMRVGEHAVVWYLPIVARWQEGNGVQVWPGLLPGLVVAHAPRGERNTLLFPRILDRPPQRASIDLFQREPADQRQTGNCRRLLEWRELLRRPLPPAFARALLDASKDEDLAEWLVKLPARSNDPARATSLVESIRGLLGPEDDLGRAITFESTRTRDFEERYWKTIAFLTEGELRDKNNADAVTVNDGRSGGVKAGGRPPAKERHLDRVADWLHVQYAELIASHGMTGRAVCADHWFKWETDFDFSWSESWRRNQTGEQRERNVIVLIPGKDRSQAVIMADHYDTAYMEDVYDPARGGDRLRAAAAGADDNHSATAALLLAAEVFLRLAHEGKLERDVWLVHLTGEEFPADCLGARALAAALVAAQGEGKLVLEAPDGRRVDVTRTRVVGAYVLDMVAHNRDSDRDVFQIAPGEGRSSARLAWIAWRANQRWNRSVKAWNQGPDRGGRGRGRRVASGATPPPIAEHLALLGEVRPEWDPRSALYNTDGQIFSDLGIPVVLFMENYDIRRSGYHDTEDTMKNIDLDYGAALVAIAIESVAEAAGEPPSA